MKDLFNEIKENKINKFTKKIQVIGSMASDNKELKLFSLLNELELFLSGPKELLNSIAPLYNKNMIQVDYQNIGKAFLGDELDLEARFYRVNKRTIELKVFVRKFDHKRKSTKIARASYTFHAEYKGKSAA